MRHLLLLLLTSLFFQVFSVSLWGQQEEQVAVDRAMECGVLRYGLENAKLIKTATVLIERSVNEDCLLLDIQKKNVDDDRSVLRQSDSLQLCYMDWESDRYLRFFRDDRQAIFQNLNQPPLGGHTLEVSAILIDFKSKLFLKKWGSLPADGVKIQKLAESGTFHKFFHWENARQLGVLESGMAAYDLEKVERKVDFRASGGQIHSAKFSKTGLVILHFRIPIDGTDENYTRLVITVDAARNLPVRFEKHMVKANTEPSLMLDESIVWKEFNGVFVPVEVNTTMPVMRKYGNDSYFGPSSTVRRKLYWLSVNERLKDDLFLESRFASPDLVAKEIDKALKSITDDGEQK